MKKSLSLIKAIFIILVIGACHNINNSTKHNYSTRPSVKNDTLSLTDSIKPNVNNPGAIIGKEQKTSSDTITVNRSGQAILHHAPDDVKIDSIKKSKMKHKK